MSTTDFRGQDPVLHPRQAHRRESAAGASCCSFLWFFSR